MSLTGEENMGAKTSLRVLNCLLISGSLIAAAHADESQEKPKKEQALKLETLSVTANRIEREALQESLSISVIGQDEIRSIGSTHINEILNRVPGVWISRGNGQEHLTAIRSGVLTGAGSCGAFYFAEDGIPLRSPGFCNVNELFDANSEQAQSIEVLRGPGTAVHGSNALNGVINVISPAIPDAGEKTGNVAVEAGPHDYGRIKLQYGEGQKDGGMMLSFHGESDNGYKDDSGFDQQKMTLRHLHKGETWNITSQLAASNLNQETAGYLNGKDAYKDDDLKKLNGNPEAFRNSLSVRYFSRFEREGNNDSRLVLTPYLRYTEMEFLQHFLPNTPLEENGERSAGLQTIFFHQPSEDLTLHNGFDAELTKAYLKETQSAPSSGVFPTGKHYDYEVDSIYAAWFIGSDWQINESNQLSMGIRYDIQLYDYDNLMVDGNFAEDGTPCPVTASNPTGACRFSRPSDDVNQFRNASYRIGYLLNMTDYSDLFVNAAHGFRAPQASEMYRLQATQQSTDLNKESLDSIELGLRTKWSRLSWQLNAYFMEKDELIIQDNNRNNFNGGATRSRGVEFSMDWALTNTVSWALQSAYAKHTFNNDVLANKYNDLTSAPRKTASTQLNWKMTDSSRLTLEAAYTGEYFLDDANDHTYPGHTLVNLRWQQDYKNNAYSIIRVNNLGDVDYAERARYSFGNYQYFVGEPRAVFIELGLRY
ncbi:TonB-dependent receptor [Spongiibacter sp. KMU-158]|uniref:TonB-dependent receptor n=1 Tax=Spongiibacter pelagi TaxID=2760804 RepID=A0A927BZR7_9GAMM|nr:TonB-dependent receptor [Spongiibacter pelagi]MBD2858599.1 TonB-dependent receptor [Spongiibacter pelagi]